jgi:psp operon transcriptional activator
MPSAAPAATAEPALPGALAGLPLRDALAAAEREILARALADHRGNRQATARALGIDRSTLFHKLRRHGLGPMTAPGPDR